MAGPLWGSFSCHELPARHEFEVSANGCSGGECVREWKRDEDGFGFTQSGPAAIPELGKEPRFRDCDALKGQIKSVKSDANVAAVV